MRAQSQDSNIIGSPNYDDGDRNFSNGSLVTNRLDLLSEFDFIYKRQMGFRVSGARLVRQRVQQPRQHATTRPPTRWSTGCRSPAR